MSDTTTLYLVRHGETEYNRNRIVQGRGIDAPLNQTGRQQAEALSMRFAGIHVDAVYTSSMRRAIETASFVLKDRPGTPHYTLDDLDEMAWGELEGRSPTPDVVAIFDHFRSQWAGGCFDEYVEGGESILDVQRRCIRAIDTIMSQHVGQTLLVVTHGRLLRVLLCSVLEEYGLEHMQQMPHINTAVNRITCNDGVFTADSLNCTMHLEEPNHSV